MLGLKKHTAKVSNFFVSVSFHSPVNLHSVV